MTDVEKFESLKSKLTKLRELDIKLDVEIENTETQIKKIISEIGIPENEIESYKNKSESELKKTEDEIVSIYNEIQNLKL